jgi:nitroimidazol reductase NimA-like FMN-containing flavoprotein (pyridoxamine 5'-phosphate oxidase superfamily)
VSNPHVDAATATYLERARIPLRLACNAGQSGPLVLSLWYLPEEGRLWCATPARARVARWLARDPRCGFEVAENTAPYRGVRGQGRARLDPARGDEILRRLVQRYLGREETPFARWLLSRREPEVAIALEIERMTSWDFTKRMSAAKEEGT